MKSFILTYNLYTFDEVRNLTFFVFLFSRLLTFDDLFDPNTTFTGKLTPRASFWGIICLLLKKIKIWPFQAPFRDFWPLLTFFDPKTDFFEKLPPRASIWGIICLLLAKSQNLPKEGQTFARNDKNGQKWPFFAKFFFSQFILKIWKKWKILRYFANFYIFFPIFESQN